MKQISIQDLKANLSATIAEAEGGSTILITRHNRAVARIAPADLSRVHVGNHFGRAKLRPLRATSTRGQYLEVLLEDRRGGDDR